MLFVSFMSIVLESQVFELNDVYDDVSLVICVMRL